MAPALTPIHPMTADAAEMAGQRELAGTLGYAAAPGAGLGESVIPGTPYVEGELRWAVIPQVQLTVGAEVTFQHYYAPWLNAVSLGTKVTAWQDPELGLAVAFAPRVVGASALNLFGVTATGTNNKYTSAFGTRSLGFELPMLITHKFENGWALTLQLWGRNNLLRQEDSVASSTGTGTGSGSINEPITAPVDTGYTWGAGAAVMFSFPKMHGSLQRYHAFFGAERLWLTQTSASGEPAGQLNPLVTLNRYSLVLGLGTTMPW